MNVIATLQSIDFKVATYAVAAVVDLMGSFWFSISIHTGCASRRVLHVTVMLSASH